MSLHSLYAFSPLTQFSVLLLAPSITLKKATVSSPLLDNDSLL